MVTTILKWEKELAIREQTRARRMLDPYVYLGEELLWQPNSRKPLLAWLPRFQGIRRQPPCEYSPEPGC